MPSAPSSDTGSSTNDFWCRAGKRAFDTVIAGSAVVVLAPLFLVVTIGVLLTLGSPVIFRQRRPGRNGHPFTIYKFRTMRQGAPGEDTVETDSKRLTRFGDFLRKSSIDELPELFNVLRGDMSLVGPRPLMMEYLLLYTEEQMRRHDLRPGITGWAQINGRNSVSWEDKFTLDVWYVDNCSFWLDMKIILLTFREVLLGKGVSKSGYVTTDRFRGSSQP